MAKKNHKPLKCIECGATRSKSKKPFTIDSLRDHMADMHGLGGDKFYKENIEKEVEHEREAVSIPA